ncbi:MAG: hypothetical protein U0931_37000 [Vulcanimicrobiota bacterium]
MIYKLRWVSLLATLLLAALTQNPEVPYDEVGPVSLVGVAVTYILFRAPRRRLRLWELPFMGLATACAGYGVWWYEPIVFLTVYTVLAVTFGFAATAVGKKRREQTIIPAWQTFHLGFIGPILPPFAFVYYWFRPRT